MKVTVRAPAKLNLTLEVMGKRPDGYHEIRSLMQAVSLYDDLDFEPAPQVRLDCDIAGWSPERSLVLKALNLLRESFEIKQGAHIRIEKRIPLLSGLGGDSSDAAATLLGLNRLWKLGLSKSELVGLAGRLGSDVPFFLQNGTVLAEGRGEIVSPLPGIAGVWFVIVIPGIERFPGKTARLYAGLNANHFTGGDYTTRALLDLKKDRLNSASLFNTFENIAFDLFINLKTYREHLFKLGADNIHLAGSGPALFSMLDNKDRAENLLRVYRDQKIEAYLAKPVAGTVHSFD